MKLKYNLEGIEATIEDCYCSLAGYYTCNLLDNLSLHKEKKLYQEIFEINSPFQTFYASFVKLYGKSPETEEIKEIRLLALSFLYEICRLKNNRKASGF